MPYRERPWAVRARELEAKEGPWCDFASWIEYMEQKEEELLPESCASIMDALDYMQKAYLYSWMSDLAEPREEAADVPVIVEDVR